MNDIPIPARQLFYNLCVTYELDYDDLQNIAKAAGVHKGVVGDMFMTVAVKRAEMVRINIDEKEIRQKNSDRKTRYQAAE